jgi:CelD/BcsL family acetyltransferase involved in cellulose biosynthesis
VTFRVLDASTAEGRSAWLELWRARSGREVMAHPDFACLFARPCDRVVCAAGEDERGAILFPLLLRPLAAEPWAAPGEARWDATNPYGYGGPFAFGEPDGDAYWRAHAGWCREAGIVSTFARLSLFPGQLARLPGPVEERSRNVVIPLAGGVDAVWRGYESKVRRWVQTAERAGLTVERDATGARLDAFVEVYGHTMRRRGADDWYLFPRSFFEAIFERLAGHCAFFHTLSGGEVVSSDLVLEGEEHVYYFLGGTRAEAFPLGPNYLLKHRIAVWAIEAGKKFYVLGGGYAEGDGLFRYKRAYARAGEVPFQVACLVHDRAGYEELGAARAAHAAREGRAWSPRPGFFPSYRG